jgi:hypothetical protein
MPDEDKDKTSFVESEEEKKAREDAEKQEKAKSEKTQGLTPFEYAIQSMAVAQIAYAKAEERLAFSYERIAVAMEKMAERMGTSCSCQSKQTVPQQTSPSPTPQQTPQPTPQDNKAIEQAKALFPADLEQLLTFEILEDKIKIKPKAFLGSENFAKIVSVCKAAGGEYVSAGKASHFVMPLKK